MTAQQTLSNTKSQIIEIYQKQYRSLTSSKKNQPKRTFITSSAYTFLEDLIHLHSEQIKSLVRKGAADVMSALKLKTDHEVFENMVDNFEEMNEDETKKTVFYNLEKMIKYVLFKECKSREDKDVHLIDLEIQCSLNYTCPRCLRDGQKQSPTSLKVIQLDTQITLKEDIKQPKTVTNIVNPAEETISKQRKSKLDTIFDGLRRERRKESQAKTKRNLKLKKWWQSTGDLLQLEENPFWSLNSPSTIQVKKKQLFDGLFFRNITNQTMIHTYRQKRENKNKRKLARSLSIKPPKDDNFCKEPVNIYNEKIHSMKEIQPKRLKSAYRKRTVMDVKTKIVAPIFGEKKINMFELQIDTNRPTPKNSMFTKRKTYNFEPQLLDRIRQSRIKSSIRIIK